MNILVTGGAGFIGSNVCRELECDGLVGRVVALDDLSTGLASNLEGLDHVELIIGSVLDDKLVTELAAGVDAIVHLAAVPNVARSLQRPRASHEANATGTVVVLEAARAQDCYVIVASSSSVYGTGAALPAREEQPTFPVSPYAASKLAAESYALAYARSFGLKVLALRLFNVYGPLQRADHAYAAVIPAFVAAALGGSPLVFQGDGTQTRDFTYVGDVATVICQALSRGVTSEGPVNLAFSSRTSLLSLASEIEDLIGERVSRVNEAPRKGDVRDSQGDSTRLLSLFPKVIPTPLSEGLRATIDWFSDLNGIPGAAKGVVRSQGQTVS